MKPNPMNPTNPATTQAEETPHALTLKEVKRLKVGDKLTWDNKTSGEVIETGYLGARIHWSDNQTTTLFLRDIQNNVARVMERLAKIRRASK
mgnify:CR=1 FL=1